MRCVTIGSLLALGLMVFGAAQAQQPAGEADDQLVLRTYDVGDLVMNVHDHAYREAVTQTNRGGPQAASSSEGGFTTAHRPTGARIQFAQYGGGMGGGGGGFGGGRGGYMGGGGGMEASTDNGMNVTLGGLIDGIVTTIAPDSWSDRGGDAQITAIGKSIVVSQTPQVHQMIAGLLDALRSGSGKRQTLRVDARWLLLMSDDLDKLLSGDEGKIDRKTLEFLTRQPTTIRGITKCFSGQKVYLVSGTRRNMVQSYIPVVGSVEGDWTQQPRLAGRQGSVISLVSDQGGFGTGNSVGYQPIVGTSNFGALLEIRPTLVVGDEEVTVDLKSTITVPGQRTGAAVVSPPADGVAPSVDRIAIETQQFATTLRMPLGEPYLVGGMTYAPTIGEFGDRGDGESANQEKPQLYLILELR
ncbi:hypothetical protein NG895_03235 [Aeoliella sp. ICT_H6.2]|uniref:Type II/III secretion system protein n=1 Tax=Aeoliella straminimaris TaxID=2954799 RepID=A0A9X2JFY1_9BACT|nr:hypothetical protein [Aeoliella straminimaris]MCO6042913.1 hypothetical protein [Aeoliella straminimaris]